MTFYSAMVNAWALAASILDGTFDEDYPIMTDDDKNRVTPQESDEYDPPKTKREDFWIDDPTPDTIHIDTSNYQNETLTITGGEDQLSFNTAEEGEDWVKAHGGYEWTPGSAWPPNDEPNPFPSDPISDNDDQIAHHVPTYEDAMMPGIEEEKRKWIYESPDGGKTVYRHELGKDPLKRELVPQENNANDIEFKYNEDVTLKEVEEYVKSTYKSHYANDNKTQTLDLINSIGDTESFSKANAIKYLSRFGKKDGKSKFDILKAIHYCILLYHFSGLHNDN